MKKSKGGRPRNEILRGIIKRKRKEGLSIEQIGNLATVKRAKSTVYQYLIS